MAKDNRQNEIIRIQKKRNNFVMLDKGFLEDERLSCKAKGILAYLLSKPDNWKVIVGDIAKHCRDGVDSIYAGLKELKDLGYYVKRPVRNEKGVITHWDSVIYEDPSENVVNTPVYPLRDFPDMAEPDMANPFMEKPEHNNNYVNKNYLNNNESSQSQRQTDEEPDKTPDADTQHEVKSVSKIKSTSAIVPISRTYQAAEVPKNSNSDYNTYSVLIKTNIEYNSFSNPDDRKLADSLIETMLDVITTESPKTVKIGKETKSRDIVKAIYLKLNHEHITHVISQFRAQPRKITYKGAYMRTMLFTVYSELEAAIINKEAATAKHDPVPAPQQPPAKEQPQKKNRFVNFQQRNIDFAELERLENEQLKASILDWDHLEQTSL